MSSLWLPEGRGENRAAVLRELRDPRGATRSTSYQGVGRPQLTEWDARRAIEGGYNASWLVAKGLKVIADTVSRLPFRAGADLEKPQEFSQNAPLARLLGPPPEGPNPEMSARTLWRQAVLNYLLTGRFAWEIEYADGGDVVGLWSLPMATFSAVETNGGRSYFSGFEQAMTTGPPVKYTREQIVYAWNPSPADVRQPESLLKSLRLNISLLLALDQYQWAFVSNDAKPATLVLHGPMADRETKEAFERKFVGDFRGPTNANKTAFIEVDLDDTGDVGGQVDIKVLGSSAKDSRLVEIYTQQMQAISSGLGVPMSLLDASGRTFDNAGQEAKNYYELTVLPLLTDLQDAVNRDLAPKLGSEVGWFDISGIEALKPSFTEGTLMSDVEGDLTRNERRSFAGLGPVDEVQLAKEKAEAIDQAQAAFEATQPKTPVIDPSTQTGAPDKATTNGSANDTGKATVPAQRVGTRTAKPHAFVPHEEAGDGIHDDDCEVCEAGPNDEIHSPAKRHRGPEGHDPVTGGHVKKAGPEATVEAAVERARKVGADRTSVLLGRQMRRYDEQSQRSTLARADGKRGRQAIDRAAGDLVKVVDGIYDIAFWTAEARAALAPVYEAAVGSAATALEGFVPCEADLGAWCDARADALAQVLVRRRHAAIVDGLRALDSPVILPADLVVASVAAHAEPGLGDLAPQIIDDALATVTGVPRATVRDLLAKLVTGEMDLDAAMEELIP